HRRTLIPPFALIPDNVHLTSTSAPHQQIFPPVPIHITPAHSRPQLAQLVRQQRLPRKIIILFFMMAVLEQLAHVLVNWLLVVGCWLLVGSWRFLGAWSLE